MRSVEIACARHPVKNPLRWSTAFLDPVEGLPGIGAVLVDQECREVVEARLVGVGHVRALADLRLPVLELLVRHRS
jgi:hypothetical protein